MQPLRVDILTLFPEMFPPILGASILGRATDAGALEWQLCDIREFTHDRHRTVDDRPYGGGPGMVLKCEPVFEAVAAATAKAREQRPALAEVEPLMVLLTPQGRRLDQPLVTELAQSPWLMLICGHYEGFDERIRLGLKPLEVSLGDFVLTGGELPAMAIVDAVARLLPGVLGDEESARAESFGATAAGQTLLDCPHYTRPEEVRGMRVPPVLLSGDHEAVARWRLEQAVQRTAERRPDLLRVAPEVVLGNASADVGRDADVIRRPRGAKQPSRGAAADASADAGGAS